MLELQSRLPDTLGSVPPPSLCSGTSKEPSGLVSSCVWQTHWLCPQGRETWTDAVVRVKSLVGACLGQAAWPLPLCHRSSAHTADSAHHTQSGAVMPRSMGSAGTRLGSPPALLPETHLEGGDRVSSETTSHSVGKGRCGTVWLLWSEGGYREG